MTVKLKESNEHCRKRECRKTFCHDPLCLKGLMTPFAHRENIRLGMRCGKVFRDAMWESVQGCDVGKCLGMRCGKVEQLA